MLYFKIQSVHDVGKGTEFFLSKTDLCSSLIFKKLLTHVYIISLHSYYLTAVLDTEMKSESFILPSLPSKFLVDEFPLSLALLLYCSAPLLQFDLLSSPLLPFQPE